MIAPDSVISCEKAKPFYYDLLFAEAPEFVPAEVQDHVRTCVRCREEMNRLQEALSRVKTGEDEDPLKSVSLLTKSLTLQFSLAGREVTCTHIKPFLAILNIAGLETNIPTPVMAHLDHCPVCSEEFQIIQKLSLHPAQLNRLSQLFSETTRPDPAFCAVARDQIPRLAAMESHDFSPELLNHICRCRLCRELYYNACWDRFRALSESSRQHDIECEGIQASDIFNLAVPYGLTAEDVEKMFLPDSPASHIKDCPLCLKKLRDMHRSIYPILDKQRFDVTTRFQIAEIQKEKTGPEKSREFYRDWPIEVTVTEVPEISPEIAGPIEPSEASRKEKRNFYAWLFQKRFAYPAAAAAIILIALSLIFSTPPATAVSMDQIRGALVQIDAIHISKWGPGRTEPIQESWICRSANLYVHKTGNSVVSWDFANQGTRTRDLRTGSVDYQAAAPESLEKARSYMKSALGLLPVQGLFDLSRNATWRRISVETQEAETTAIEIYELEWKRIDFDGLEVSRKWYGYIDPDTHLPQKIEWYKKTPKDNDYVLETTCSVEYLNPADIQAAVNSYLP